MCGFSTSGGDTSYAAYRKRAKEAFLQGKFEKAFKLYGKAGKKWKRGVDPDNLEEVYVSRAVCCLGLNRYNDAITETDKAIEIDESNPKAYYRKAEALGKSKRYEEAFRVFDQCLRLNLDGETRDWVSLRRLALSFEEADDRDGFYFRFLVPGVDYCISRSFNPITKVIFEIGAQMRNIIYLLGDRRSMECVVVDPCWDVDGILKAVQADGMRIVGVLQTHNHFDHVGGRPPAPFDSYRITVPGVKKLLEKLDATSKVYIHEQDADVFQNETEVDPQKIQATTDGYTMNIGRMAIRFFHTPGHTPGSQCIQVNDRRILTGDTLFVGSCGRVDLPGGDESQLYNSLQNVLAQLPDETLLFPAHLYSRNLMTTVALEKRHGVLQLIERDAWLRSLGLTETAGANDSAGALKEDGKKKA